MWSASFETAYKKTSLVILLGSLFFIGFESTDFRCLFFTLNADAIDGDFKPPTTL